MSSLVVRVLGAIGAATLCVALVGSGVASAEDLTGKTFSDAKATIAGLNGKAVIATVNGDQLQMDDCVVTSWQKSMFLDSSGNNNRSNEYRLHLNCNAVLAAPGHPGNSVATPDGIRAKKQATEDQQSAEKINQNPEWCHESDENLKACASVCKRSGLCEI
jgi:hypothetical protein